MKAALALFAAAAAAPLAAANTVPLAGVSDQETRIPSGEIREFHRGNGDVMFVRDRENKWFRVAFNSGCLKGTYDPRSMSFSTQDVSGRIDQLTRVTIYGAMTRTCLIDSIRRSVAPPQVDSKSPITLD
ncbi:MAG: hypothetical protein ACO1OD_06165 [Croceibacterium sp.]